MRLGADRAQGHGAGGKALDDLAGRLHLIHRNSPARLKPELKQTAQRHVASALVVDQLSVFLVGAPIVGTGAVLQLGDGIGRPHVFLATHPPGVFTAGVKHVGKHRVGAEGGAVHANRLFGNLEHADALDPAGRAAEILGHRGAGQTDSLKQLGATVAHVGGDAHLGHDLGEALAHCLDVVVDGLVSTQFARQVLVHAVQGF